MAPGVVEAYNRNEWSNARLRKAGITVLEIDGSELGLRPRVLHDLPDITRFGGFKRETHSLSGRELE